MSARVLGGGTEGEQEREPYSLLSTESCGALFQDPKIMT